MENNLIVIKFGDNDFALVFEVIGEFLTNPYFGNNVFHKSKAELIEIINPLINPAYKMLRDKSFNCPIKITESKIYFNDDANDIMYKFMGDSMILVIRKEFKDGKRQIVARVI